MATWTQQTKNTTTLTQQTKNAATWDYEISAGDAWAYNQADFTYNQLLDKTGDTVYYNSVGVAQSYDYLTKH